jgi:hypothetical protein
VLFFWFTPPAGAAIIAPGIWEQSNQAKKRQSLFLSSAKPIVTMTGRGLCRPAGGVSPDNIFFCNEPHIA